MELSHCSSYKAVCCSPSTPARSWRRMPVSSSAHRRPVSSASAKQSRAGPRSTLYLPKPRQPGRRSQTKHMTGPGESTPATFAIQMGICGRSCGTLGLNLALLLDDLDDPLHPELGMTAPILCVHEAHLYVDARLGGDRLLLEGAG